MQINCNGLTVLEPSAGKGNIINYLKDHGAKDVNFCEINTDLAEICKSKARFIKHDFLKVTAEEISHVNQIVMNPPFTRARQHILHAWQIAPEGCEIITLFNADSIRRRNDDELSVIVEDYGNTIELGKVFKTAERYTEVNIACIKLYKPITTQHTNFDGFYMDIEPEARQENGIMQFNEIQSLVSRYTAALRSFEQFEVMNESLKKLCEPVGMGAGFKYEIRYNSSVTTLKDFAKELQRHSWQYIFSKMNLGKYLTSGVMEDINRFCEHQSNVPFTVKNIFRMFEIIVGTAEQNFKRALVEAVDEFTKYTHENRYNLEGWKTNAGHLLNKKFIINYVFRVKSFGNGKLDLGYSQHNKQLDDLVKVLCNITGTNYEDIRSLYRLVSEFNGIEPNRWYCNGFFEIKGFKKGTIHIKFQDEKVWELLNRKYAEAKGFTLPEKF